jgi:cytochrome c oxidase subunit II
MHMLAQVNVERAIICAIGLWIAWPVPAQALPPGDPIAGRAYYTACSGCHGIYGSGNRDMNAPNLTVLDPKYFLSQLRNFSSHVRGSPDDYFGLQMQDRANWLPNQEAMKDVIAYVDTLPKVWSRPTLQGDVGRGRILYVNCAPCHGAFALGNPELGAPRLAGASDWYLARQIEDFRNALRGASPGDEAGVTMRVSAQALPDEKAIMDVVAYVSAIAMKRGIRTTDRR